MIRRDSVRFDPLYGDMRHRVPPRARAVRSRIAAVDPDDQAKAATRYAHQFMLAFTGGLIFFSILIF